MFHWSSSAIAVVESIHCMSKEIGTKVEGWREAARSSAKQREGGQIDGAGREDEADGSRSDRHTQTNSTYMFHICMRRWHGDSARP